MTGLRRSGSGLFGSRSRTPDLDLGRAHSAPADPDLAKQIRRAINSGREAIFGLRIAGAAGYLEAERVAREVGSPTKALARVSDRVRRRRAIAFYVLILQEVDG